MSRFTSMFERLRSGKKKAIMPFFVLGDPNEETCLELLKAAVDGGADALELGMAFSDPIADGPTVQEADVRALASGMTTAKALSIVKRVRAYAPETPIGLLVYYNLVFQPGLDAFCKAAEDAGVDALLAADVPVEEITPLKAACVKHGLDTVMLAALTTPDARLEKILGVASGYLYVVAVLGVTGARKDVQDETLELIARLRKRTQLPLVVGFGISTPQQARRVCDAGADGAIVGSALIKALQEHAGDGKAMATEAKRFVAGLKSGLEC